MHVNTVSVCDKAGLPFRKFRDFYFRIGAAKQFHDFYFRNGAAKQLRNPWVR